ncbi:MAG: hypothetical protein WA051_00045 [Minisyncoccia bacterium]
MATKFKRFTFERIGHEKVVKVRDFRYCSPDDAGILIDDSSWHFVSEGKQYAFGQLATVPSTTILTTIINPSVPLQIERLINICIVLCDGKLLTSP